MDPRRTTGWYNESHRHSLAARGVSTAKYLKRKDRSVDIYGVHFNYDAAKSRSGQVGSVHGIPIVADKLKEGNVYPVSPEQVQKVMDRMPAEDLQGVVCVEFCNPQGEQKGAWAQYVRGKRKILIFSQPTDGNKIDGEDPEELRKHIELYVLPHEVGHHKALYKDKITDKSLAMAEARADANVVGLSPKDKAVKQLLPKALKGNKGIKNAARKCLQCGAVFRGGVFSPGSCPACGFHGSTHSSDGVNA